MQYICPICGREFPLDAAVYLSHGDEHIIEAIKKRHPDWSESGGVCKKCFVYFKSQLRGE